jgi:hypothetical protein
MILGGSKEDNDTNDAICSFCFRKTSGKSKLIRDA